LPNQPTPIKRSVPTTTWIYSINLGTAVTSHMFLYRDMGMFVFQKLFGQQAVKYWLKNFLTRIFFLRTLWALKMFCKTVLLDFIVSSSYR
jgi:hypothetical protein